MTVHATMQSINLLLYLYVVIGKFISLLLHFFLLYAHVWMFLCFVAKVKKKLKIETSNVKTLASI